MSSMADMANAIRTRFGMEEEDYGRPMPLPPELQQRGQSPLSEYEGFREDNPLSQIILDLLPVVGDLKGAVDMKLDQEEDPFMSALGGIRQAKALKALGPAVADLGEGGLRRFIEWMVDEGKLTADQAKRLFTSDGDFRMLHGTGNEVPAFTTEEMPKFFGSNTDMWAGPGLYLDTSTHSPVSIGGMRLGAEDNLTAYELAVPRDNIKDFSLINFQHNTTNFGMGDQTKEVQDYIQNLYPNMDPEAAFWRYQVSPMATTTPENLKVPKQYEKYVGSRMADQVNLGGNGLFDLKSADDTYQTLLASKIRGNFHDDSGIVAVAHDIDQLIPQSSHTATNQQWGDAEQLARSDAGFTPGMWNMTGQHDMDNVRKHLKANRSAGFESRYYTKEASVNSNIKDTWTELANEPVWRVNKALDELGEWNPSVATAMEEMRTNEYWYPKQVAWKLKEATHGKMSRKQRQDLYQANRLHEEIISPESKLPGNKDFTEYKLKKLYMTDPKWAGELKEIWGEASDDIFKNVATGDSVKADMTAVLNKPLDELTNSEAEWLKANNHGLSELFSGDEFKEMLDKYSDIQSAHLKGKLKSNLSFKLTPEAAKELADIKILAKQKGVDPNFDIEGLIEDYVMKGWTPEAALMDMELDIQFGSFGSPENWVHTN